MSADPDQMKDMAPTLGFDVALRLEDDKQEHEDKQEHKKRLVVFVVASAKLKFVEAGVEATTLMTKIRGRKQGNFYVFDNDKPSEDQPSLVCQATSGDTNWETSPDRSLAQVVGNLHYHFERGMHVTLSLGKTYFFSPHGVPSAQGIPTPVFMQALEFLGNQFVTGGITDNRLVAARKWCSQQNFQMSERAEYNFYVDDVDKMVQFVAVVPRYHWVHASYIKQRTKKHASGTLASPDENVVDGRFELRSNNDRYENPGDYSDLLQQLTTLVKQKDMAFSWPQAGRRYIVRSVLRDSMQVWRKNNIVVEIGSSSQRWPRKMLKSADFNTIRMLTDHFDCSPGEFSQEMQKLAITAQSLLDTVNAA